MPVLHVEAYSQANRRDALTREDKKAFLEIYYKTWNATKAAKLIGRDRDTVFEQSKSDRAFASDLEAVKWAMKEDLEEVMATNGLKEKGYMDRITWLRRNFPAEYNPNYQAPDAKAQSELKDLAEKLKGYQLIPKEKVVEVEGEEVKEEKE